MARSREIIGLPVLSAPEVPLYQGDIEADLRVVSRNRLAETITGGLSVTSKMPCPSWGISAMRCRVGQVLAKREGTVCHDCYAMKGTYGFPNVQRKLEERYRGIFHPLWTPAMVFLIRYFCDRYFRIFDSGDLQDENHYRNIITMARSVPDVQIWMPSREIRTIQAVHRELLRLGLEYPQNLVARVSAPLIDGEPPLGFPHTSTALSGQEPGEGICPAPENGGECGDCRACWDAGVSNVAYRHH